MSNPTLSQPTVPGAAGPNGEPFINGHDERASSTKPLDQSQQPEEPTNRPTLGDGSADPNEPTGPVMPTPKPTPLVPPRESSDLVPPQLAPALPEGEMTVRECLAVSERYAQAALEWQSKAIDLMG